MVEILVCVSGLGLSWTYSLENQIRGKSKKSILESRNVTSRMLGMPSKGRRSWVFSSLKQGCGRVGVGGPNVHLGTYAVHVYVTYVPSL